MCALYTIVCLFFFCASLMCLCFCAKHDVLMPSKVGSVDSDTSCARKGFSSLKYAVSYCVTATYTRAYVWAQSRVCFYYAFRVFIIFHPLLINCIAEQHTIRITNTVCANAKYFFYTSLRFKRQNDKWILQFFARLWLRGKLERIKPIGKMENYFSKERKKKL